MDDLYQHSFNSNEILSFEFWSGIFPSSQQDQKPTVKAECATPQIHLQALAGTDL
jgi:hypothetical protein